MSLKEIETVLYTSSFFSFILDFSRFVIKVRVIKKGGRGRGGVSKNEEFSAVLAVYR